MFGRDARGLEVRLMREGGKGFLVVGGVVRGVGG